MNFDATKPTFFTSVSVFGSDRGMSEFGGGASLITVMTSLWFELLMKSENPKRRNKTETTNLNNVAEYRRLVKILRSSILILII